MIEEKKAVENNIADIVNSRKEIESAISKKRMLLGERKKELQKMQKEKKRISRPVSADIENILMDHNISAAAYHGGKLNGVACRSLILQAKDIFPKFQNCLLAVDHPDRCMEQVIIDTCSVHNNICVTLDTISSKIRLKHLEPLGDDYQQLKMALSNLEYLWEIAGMSYTPKIHGVLVHALDQMKRLKGIGDMLEDDIEHMHQISARIESRTNRIKNKPQQPLVYSQIEHIQNSQEIKVKIASSQQNSQRKFKRRNDELDSSLKAKKKNRRETAVDWRHYIPLMRSLTLPASIQ